MPRALFKLLVLSLLVAGTLFALLFILPLPKAGYLRASGLKHRILKDTPSPRLVFIGGSNLAFGLDSPRLHRELGLPVVNMGLHNGLGLRFMMNEVRGNLHPGDLVVICPEYNYSLGGSHMLLELLIFVPRFGEFLAFPDYVEMFRQFPLTLQRRFEGFLNPWLLGRAIAEPANEYSTRGFNEYGDNLWHLKLKRKFKRTPQVIPVAIPAAMEAINAFAKGLEKLKVRLFLTYPPLPESVFDPDNQTRAQALHAWLVREGRFTVLGQPRDFIFPESQFHDTVYHLNATGRERRTTLMIDLLKDLVRGVRSGSTPSA